ncbi:MAG: hypothetical protein ACI9DF_003266 [Verrucomicrobiales bacterium]|jgi:hypothetical protein
MAEFFSQDGELDSGMIIRRVLFLLLLLGLGVYHLFFHFNGLTSARGIDQAQIGREIAEHKTFNTKFLRPLTIYQVNKHREDAELEGLMSPTNFTDVFHAPLNPLLNSVALRMFKSQWEYTADSGSSVYFLDRVIAGVSVILFLLAIFISYLLISRIFDTKIAGISALVVLLSATMWDFAQSGLPQMLMLFLFSFGLYFVFKAIETQQEETPPFVWIALAAGFFGLLALTHWLSMWLFFGLLFFSAFYFRPKGVMAILLFVIFTVIVAAWGYRNYQVSGDLLGSGLYSLQTGLAEGDAAAIFRNYDPEQQQFSTQGLFSKLVVNSLKQLEDLYKYLGSIVVAPLFFLSLLHPFKRPEIAHFRWCILSMWLFGVLGMTIYGLPEGRMDPNQLHILFAPIMAAYGLAFLTVVWNRIGFETNHPMVNQGHLIIVAVISAIPLILPLPKNLKAGISAEKMQRAVWPPYYPPHIAFLNEWTTDQEVIVSDIPWAVAWYANRTAVWLPKDQEQFRRLNDYVEGMGRKFAGVFISPETINKPMVTGISRGPFKDWRRVIMDGEARDMDARLMLEDFPFQEVMALNPQLYFYSDRKRWLDGR